MHLVLIFVTFWGGQLSYSEIQPFKDMEACEAAFHHMADLALHDGHQLSELNGGCYWKEDR
jgi:hypothetical protein